ncbi:hypothetical protein [Streptococcus agalactiae]
MISALVPVVGQHLGRGNKEQIRTEFHLLNPNSPRQVEQ